MTIAQSTLAGMRQEIAAGHPLLKESLRPQPDPREPGFSDLFQAALGGGGHPGAGDYRFALEFIFEGYLLHYGRSRILTERPADFCLLAGDYMFAKGLERIARLQEADCVKMFADLVSICAGVRCNELKPELALEAWAIAALSLAARAAANATEMPATGGANRMESLKKHFWRQAGRAGDAGISGGSALDEALGMFPAARQKLLQTLLTGIYSAMEPYHRRQFEA